MTSPLRVLVADDEPLARQRLVQLCSGLPDTEVVGEAATGEEVLALCRALQPAVLLLDIRMPGIDGLATARELAQWPVAPAVIFVTAYDQHALEAFDVAASAYLLKPVRREKLAAALDRLRRPATPPEPPVLLVRRMTAHGAQVHRVPVSAVLACIAGQKYVTLHTTDGEFVVDTPLRELADLPGANWVRVHRNALVAVAQVASATRTADGGLDLALRGSPVKVQASRRLAPEVLRRLGGQFGV